jgi:hypothetical protein
MHRRIFFHYNKRKNKKVGGVCTVGYFFIIIRERRGNGNGKGNGRGNGRGKGRGRGGNPIIRGERAL